MERTNDNGCDVTPSRLGSVLTDVHFWVPMAVLVAGLLLLRFMH